MSSLINKPSGQVKIPCHTHTHFLDVLLHHEFSFIVPELSLELHECALHIFRFMQYICFIMVWMCTMLSICSWACCFLSENKLKLSWPPTQLSSKPRYHPKDILNGSLETKWTDSQPAVKKKSNTVLSHLNCIWHPNHSVTIWHQW